MPYPTRIVCLTEEKTETLYLLGERDLGCRRVRLHGAAAGGAAEAAQFRASFTRGFDAIEALEPDLILALLDLQAECARARRTRPHGRHVQPAVGRDILR
jgi:iron complex transport system substrate-binding protein